MSEKKQNRRCETCRFWERECGDYGRCHKWETGYSEAHYSFFSCEDWTEKEDNDEQEEEDE